jgi:polyhydroxyalkanoate synthase
MQGSLQEGWTKALEQFQNFDAAELGLPAGQGAVPNIRFEPRQLQQVHQGYLKEAAELWNQSLQSSLSLADRRFNGEAWERNPMASFAAAVYLLNARTLMSLAEAVEADAKTKARMRFAVEQWWPPARPATSWPSTPRRRRRPWTPRARAGTGVQNLLADMRQGHVSMTDESLFEVGRTWPPPKARWCSRTSCSSSSNTSR